MIRMTIFGVLLAMLIYSYMDGKVPEPIPEQFKVKVMDFCIKMYGHTLNILVSLGLTTPFSDFDRKLCDRFILLMTTGFPWVRGYDSRLQITDTTMKSIHVRMYQPVTSLQHKRRPVLVYLHGGGWSLLSVDSYDPLMRRIAKDSGVVIISVNYRLSPQYPFPVPLNDCLDVVEYVIENSVTLNINPRKIAIGGDNAGGNMAAAISLRLKKKLALQLLIVPVLQMANWNTTSFIENSIYLSQSANSRRRIFLLLNYLNIDFKYGEHFLNNNHTSKEFKRSHFTEILDQNLWLPKRYVRDEHLRENIDLQTEFGNEELFSLMESHITDPMMSPLLADDDMLEDLPMTYIVTSGYDIVRDDGIMFSERLKQVGQKVILKHYEEAFHTSLFFPHGPLKLEVGVRIVQDIVRTLRSALH
ncbi:neutral cholesterol ester hydrolase 1-like [Ylistrum balloti]|uniref:neutral cholesterol ester hydrolase 1-like n=1 Tax=Ylistrum balloti TaxID=509963 RepID=UPI002905F712|nr:neutral cholesterol ester hydrolase 1-like [Ylistrum balloti]